jgi:hypothetical protein
LGQCIYIRLVELKLDDKEEGVAYYEDLPKYPFQNSQTLNMVLSPDLMLNLASS